MKKIVLDTNKVYNLSKLTKKQRGALYDAVPLEKRSDHPNWNSKDEFVKSTTCAMGYDSSYSRWCLYSQVNPTAICATTLFSSDDRSYFVMAERGSIPKVVHKGLAVAEEEAQRIAKKGERFLYYKFLQALNQEN